MEGVGIAVLFIAALLYFLPFFIANARRHPQQGSIFFINLIVGWTLIGWLAALIWSVTGQPETKKGDPTPDTHLRCPDCKEFVLKEACVCKHCGCNLAPQIS